MYKSNLITNLWLLSIVFISTLIQTCGLPSQKKLTLSCRDDNDLFVVMQKNSISCSRYDSPEEAIRNAPQGSGVLILADGYPVETTKTDSVLYAEAAAKELRLYVEYPSFIPGQKSGQPAGTQWERAVISSSAFAPELQKLRIIAIHDCRYIPLQVADPDIVVARVAGFDSALFGLPDLVYPILAGLPREKGTVMISTTKLSQFVTGRYAPYDAWKAIWGHILMRVRGDDVPVELEWTPTVRPSFTANEALPQDAEVMSLKRGIDWYFNSRMVMNEQMQPQYDRPSNGPEPAKANPDMTTDWPFGHRVGLRPDLTLPPGDGSFGVIEGFDAKIFYDGTQPVRWWRRGDCNGETAGAMAIAGKVFPNTPYLKTAENIGDWMLFNSQISLGERSDKSHPAYGLLGWSDVPQYCGPGTMNCYEVYYGDDIARNMLGMILAGAVIGKDKYDERLTAALLSTLRLSGKKGFQPDRIDQQPLEENGWRYYNQLETVSYSGNFQAYMWACYLWAYSQTGNELFLKTAKNGINNMMAGYPEKWGGLGLQMDRARMLLPLAWLVRVEDTPEHRQWLKLIAEDLDQDSLRGTIPEKIENFGEFGKGHYKAPMSNEKYGTTESPIIQKDSDSCSDLLYAVNFAFLGLHEAAYATGDDFYRVSAEKLADFLCRVQIKSEKHPELDGGWFRAFDFNRWEYWASNTDVGWGAWCIETGWSQSWITAVMAMRQLQTSFWDITGNNKKSFNRFEEQLYPGLIGSR